MLLAEEAVNEVLGGLAIDNLARDVQLLECCGDGSGQICRATAVSLLVLRLATVPSLRLLWELLSSDQAPQ